MTEEQKKILAENSGSVSAHEFEIREGGQHLPG